MKVSDAMTGDVRVVSPAQTIREATAIMAETDVGALPVCDGERLTGMITDRDVAIRAVARGRGPDTPVGEVMTRELKYAYADDDVDEVARTMAELQVRRLPVLDRDKRLAGIIALGDIARMHDAETAGEAVEGISQPGGPRSQT